MEMIEHYQPEFVVRFRAREAACTCPGCQSGTANWPHTSMSLGNQQRDSLNAACESAAREILLNPEAFVLHAGDAASDEARGADLWNETLNQQCINLAVHPALTLQSSLYAIGVLLSKAQRDVDEKACEAQHLVAMGEQLSQLADGGILNEQFSLLPPIEVNRVHALGEMGTMRLNLNLPPMQKMMFMLKLSELAVMQPARLQDRLRELEAKSVPLLEEHPHILRNLLIYRLYSEGFPGTAFAHYGDALKSLTGQVFQLRMLCAIWLEDNGQMSEEDFIILFSALYGWVGPQRAESNEATTADYTLLCGLSLI